MGRGRTEASAPTDGLQEVCGAGDREGRPYGVRGKERLRRDDVGSEPSAAGGRYSEVSEWPRSKFRVSAVRQRGNFGHRNRTIGPYGRVQEVPALSAGGQRRPPLRRCGKECLRRDDVGIVPYGGRIIPFIHVQDK